MGHRMGHVNQAVSKSVLFGTVLGGEKNDRKVGYEKTNLATSTEAFANFGG